jgi:Copper transport outer membrane protein, MctB
MFTFRYHIVSLAAVFVALAVGILVGAAISGKLSEAEDNFTKDRIASLNDQLADERARTADAERRSRAVTQLVEDAYPTLMEGRLADRGFAVLFLGPVKGDLRSAIERTLADAGSGSPVRVIAVDTPIDPTALDSFLLGNDELAKYAEGGDDFGDLGDALGRELIEGEGTPLWSMLSSELIEERSPGATAAAVDGAIVVRSWTPPDDEANAEDDPQVHATDTLFDGLLEGLRSSGLPVVGVETTTTTDSAVAEFGAHGLSTVDDVDAIAGRLALALLLAGGTPGHYGIKDSASDGVVPTILPVTTTTGG